MTLVVKAHCTVIRDIGFVGGLSCPITVIFLIHQVVELPQLPPSWDQMVISHHYSGYLLHFGVETMQGVV